MAQRPAPPRPPPCCDLVDPGSSEGDPCDDDRAWLRFVLEALVVERAVRSSLGLLGSANRS